MGNFSKIHTLAVLATLTLSGCSIGGQSSNTSPEEPNSLATDSATSWGDLNSCNAFQEVVWTLDNSPDEALFAVEEQQVYLLEGAGVSEKIVQDMLSYFTRLSSLISSSEPDSTLLDLMVQQPDEAEFDYFKGIHAQYGTFCNSVGFSIFDDSFLGSAHQPKSISTASTQPTQSTNPSSTERCFDSMKRASLELSSSVAERYLKETAEFCGGKAEWYRALRMYPYAMGFPDVMGNELEILCFNYGSSPACKNP